MGAYEYQAYTLVVDTLVDENDGDYSPGDFSLREALAIANIAPEQDTIEFSPNLTAGGPAKIVLTMGELQVLRSVSIAGPGADLLTIDASGNDHLPNSPGGGTRIFNAAISGSNIDFNLSGLTLTGGDDGTGGAIMARAHMTASDLVINNCRGQVGGAIFLMPIGGESVIQNCTFTDNVATSSGGAIAVAASGGTVKIINNTIANNTASTFGGAISLQGISGSTQIDANTITGNKAARGGAVYASQFSTSLAIPLILTGNTITNNSATQQGGAIFLQQSAPKTTIQSCTISGNKAAGQGGGLFLSMVRDVSIIGSTISDNKNTSLYSSTGRGGGIYINAADVAFAGCTISGNTAYTGGGIWSQNGELAINFSTIANNTATASDGGGIFSSADRLTLTDSTVSGNSAAVGISRAGRGGGLFHVTSLAAPPTILSTSFTGNAAGYLGGGVYLSLLAYSQFNGLTLTDVTISGNTAPVGGGVAVGPMSSNAVQGSVVTNGGSISGNTATTGNGGGIYARVASFTANGTTITDNRAAGNGGGFALSRNIVGTVALSFVDAAIDGNTAGAAQSNPKFRGDGGGLWISSGVVPVSLVNTSVSGNSAGRGGGIFRIQSGYPLPLVAVDSKISGNLAALRGGGGLYNVGGNLSFTRTAITGNTVTAATFIPYGGGIFSHGADVSLVSCSLSGNSSANGRGGGLYMSQSGDLTVTASTIANNFARMDGGGVWLSTTSNDRTNFLNSTISGNSSTQGTGGLRLQSSATIRQCTITANSGGGSGAGGVSNGYGSQPFELDHTIIAGNTGTFQGAPDFRLNSNSSGFTVRFSLIGDNSGNPPTAPLAEAPVGSPDFNGNLIGKPVALGGHGIINPLLGPLANNGGPTQTRALLPGSPAIDAGAVVTGTPLGYDQRGNPFSRAVDGNADGVARIDMGAYESQGVPSFAPGDYNQNGFVDAADFTKWRDTLGQHVTPIAGADGDGSGIVDSADYGLWKSNFGRGLIITPPSVGGAAAALKSIASAPAATVEARPAVAAFGGMEALSKHNGQTSLAGYRPLAPAASDTALLPWLASQASQHRIAGASRVAARVLNCGDDQTAGAEAVESAFDTFAHEGDLLAL
jgi:predicted outer membrane repeat protein